MPQAASPPANGRTPPTPTSLLSEPGRLPKTRPPGCERDPVTVTKPPSSEWGSVTVTKPPSSEWGPSLKPDLPAVSMGLGSPRCPRLYAGFLAEEHRAALGQLEAAAAVLGPFLRLPAEVVLDVLARTAGGGQVARRTGADARLQALVHVHRPVEPLTQEVLGPALRVAQEQAVGALLKHTQPGRSRSLSCAGHRPRPRRPPPPDRHRPSQRTGHTQSTDSHGTCNTPSNTGNSNNRTTTLRHAAIYRRHRQ